jgi:hypothetical protein
MTSLICSRLSPLAAPTLGDPLSSVLRRYSNATHYILHWSLLVTYVVYLSELLHLESGPVSAKILRPL